MLTFKGNIKKIFFIGIGGCNISGLAIMLSQIGYEVTGSDQYRSKYTELLERNGIKVYYDHDESHITSDIDMLVYSVAVPDSNPELIIGRKLGLRIFERAQLLGIIMDNFPKNVVVAGTNGKTTTTAMVYKILATHDYQPSLSIGEIVPELGTNFQLNKSQFFIAEGCEYYDSFLRLKPYIGVITNVEAEHLDYYYDIEHILESFVKFANNISPSGILVICNDHLRNQCQKRILNKTESKYITYGLNEDSDFIARNITWNKGYPSYELYYRNQYLTKISLSVNGIHNIYNSLAAISVCNFLGLELDQIKSGIEGYQGIYRRLEYLGEEGKISVYDDLGSHPAELRATLDGLRRLNHCKRIITIFKPVSYTRVGNFLNEYHTSFNPNDVVIVTDIQPSRDTHIDSSLTVELVKHLNCSGVNSLYIQESADIIAYAKSILQEGDFILTTGYKEVRYIGSMLLEQLKIAREGVSVPIING